MKWTTQTIQTAIVSKCVTHTWPIPKIRVIACQHTMLSTRNADLLDLLDPLVPTARSDLQLADQLWQVLLLSSIGSQIQQMPEVGCVHVWRAQGYMGNPQGKAYLGSLEENCTTGICCSWWITCCKVGPAHLQLAQILKTFRNTSRVLASFKCGLKTPKDSSKCFLNM